MKKMLAEAAGADICRIETKDPYPEVYDETVALAKRQMEEGPAPELEPSEKILAATMLWPWGRLCGGKRWRQQCGASWRARAGKAGPSSHSWPMLAGRGRLSAIWNLWQSQQRSQSRSRCASIQAEARAW